MLASERILALDIGAASVKIGEFQASKTHGLRLTNFNYAELGIDPEHEENRKSLLISTIRNALREKNFKATSVVFSVSGQSVFTRFVKLPPVDESKVVQIIQYEAQQNVPFPIDEVIWDYQILGNTEGGELEVVLLAIKSEIIEDLNQGVESVGLRTETIDVAPMALSNAVRYNEGDSEGCTILVDIGARTTNLLFLEKNRIFSRSIPIAGNAITQSIASEFNVPFLDAEAMKKAKGFVALGGAYEEPEDEQQARISKIIRNVMTRLHAEIARSVNFYKGQQGGGAPQRLLLSGGSSIIPYTDRFFQEKLQIPVQLFSPFRNVELGEGIQKEDLAKCAHFFGEVVGLGLRRVTHCPVEVNLIPKSIKARKQMLQKRPYFFGAAAALLLIPLCLLAYTKKTTELKERELTDVRAEVEKLSSLDAQIKKRQTDLTEIKASADQVAGVVQERSFWMDLLNDFNQRCISNLWITTLVPEACGGSAAAPGGGGGGAPRNFGRGGFQAEPDVPPPTAAAATATPGCTELRIDGGGFHTMNDLDVVDQFARNLRQSDFFDKTAPEQGVVIETFPSMTREATFNFSIRARLKKPVLLPTN
ncbi:MAG: Cell division protein FtsA [Verrucomicrobiae bacterium]|nr:Cell division protein FtsA [Verrucomicrobiae bacterium]